jgi:hypothetical protein
MLYYTYQPHVRHIICHQVLDVVLRDFLIATVTWLQRLGAGFSPCVSLRLVYMLQLPHTRLLPPLEECDNPDHVKRKFVLFLAIQALRHEGV